MENFLDRKLERTKVSKWFSINSTLPLCIIVAGRPGVGKTSFTKYVCSKDVDRLYVRASIPSNIGPSIQAGSYIRRLAIEIDSLIREQTDVESFEERSRKKSRKGAIKDAANTALGFIVPEKLRKRLFTIHEKWTGTGASDWEKELYGESPPELSELRDYLTKILQELPIGIVIENAQNMDEYTLSWMQNIAAISKGHSFIFEWTFKESADASQIRDLRNIFEPYCCVSNMLLLEKLPFEYALKVIPPNRDNARKWLQDSYGMWDGNLVPLVDLDVVIASESNLLTDNNSLPAIEDNSAEKFKQLEFDLQVIMSVVILSGGQIEKDDLFYCYIRHNPIYTAIDFTANIDKLTEVKLLKSSAGSMVSIRHDTIVNDLVNDLRFIKAQTIAAGIVRQYCEDRLAEKELTLSALQNLTLFQFKAQIFLDDIAGAIRSLEHICKLKSAHHSPAALCDTLNGIVLLCKKMGVTLPSSVIEKLVIQIAAICIRSRNFGPTEGLLELVEKPNIETKLLEALVLLGLEKSEEALKVCQLAARDCEPRSRRHQCAQIVSYVAERHLGKIAVGRTKWRALCAELRDGKPLLKGFVLRNSEMFLSPRESIPYLIQSVRFFSDHENEIQYAYSLNSLAAQLLRIHRYTLAKLFFERSLSILKDVATDSLSIENNLAIANIRLGDMSSATLKLFERAAIGTNNSFGQLSVANNLSSYYFLVGDEQQAIRSAFTTTQLIQRGLISSPQVKNSIYQSLKIIASHYDDANLKQSVNLVEVKVECEPDVYTNTSTFRTKVNPSFIILSNWYPDPDIILSPS